MARWGSTDFRQLKRLQKKMEKLQSGDFEKFCEEAAKELAARLLAKVIKRTPVADPSKWKMPVKGYVGGTLRRGWTAQTESEALGGGKSKNVKAYAESLNIRKVGNTYEIEVINPVNYALT